MTGMTRDMSVSRFNANLAFDARNIRITSRGEDHTLLSVTNEKGTALIEDVEILGTVIGTASFSDTLIVFSCRDNSFTPNVDYIYRINNTVEGPEVIVLFQGMLNFNVSHPLETLPIVENSFIRKVYWVDGINQPRMINIENYTEETGPETNPDKFNFIRELSHLTESPTQLEITKNPNGGTFPPGTVQYCFTYFDKFGQETTPVDVSPLYYLSPTDKGLPEDGYASNSFIVKIKDLDTNFEYVRLYAIVRTSEGATPTVRIVGDYSTGTDGTYYPTIEVPDGIEITQNSAYIGTSSLEEVLGNTSVETLIEGIPRISASIYGSFWLINPNRDIIKELEESDIENNQLVLGKHRLLLWYDSHGDQYTAYWGLPSLNYTIPNVSFDADTNHLTFNEYGNTAVCNGKVDSIIQIISLSKEVPLRNGEDKYTGDNNTIAVEIPLDINLNKKVLGKNDNPQYPLWKYESYPTLVVSDSGEHGSSVDATLLLFMLGHRIVGQTLTAKDNTLFIGNLTDTTDILGNLVVENMPLAEKAKTIVPVSTYIDYDGTTYISEDYHTLHDKEAGTPLYKEPFYDRHKLGTSGTKFYDYPINNNRNSRQLKSFKSGETYRLGFIAQDSFGRWSEAIWIKDVKETLRPARTVLFQNNYCRGTYANTGFSAIIPSSIVACLYNNGYKKIAPVVVYPQGKDRTIVAQGILAGTVYNVGDRYGDSPFVQADWRFRTGYSWNHIGNEIQTCAGYNRSGTYNYEASSQCPELPKAITTSDNKMEAEEFESCFKEHFYRDPSIITFHSPDIEFDESLRNGDFLGLKLNIVGFSTLGFAESGTTTENLGLDYGSSADSVGAGYAYEPEFNRAVLLKTGIGFANFSTKEDISKTYKDFVKLIDPNDTYFYPSVDQFKALQFSGFLDVACGYDNDGNLVSKTIDWDDNYPSKAVGFHWLTYLWHRNGSLNNQPPLTTKAKSAGTSRTAMLQRKCISELRYSRTFWQGTETAVPIETPKLVDSDQNTMVTITHGDKKIIYYNNIDKVLVPNTTSFDWKIGNTTNHVYKEAGYTVRPLSIDYVDEKESKPTGWESLVRNLFRPVKGLRSYLDSDNDFNVSKDPVYMRYKTTRHLVIPLSLNSGVYTTLKNQNSAEDISGFFWATAGDTATGIDYQFHLNNNHVFVADLYREFTPEQELARFGGTSKEALAANDWLICGEPKAIPQSGTIVLDYVEGDTYVMRYDCLKSYPYSQEDPNSVVSIFSTELETRVNLDFRYDRNRGLEDNTLITPQNFNLLNRPGYEQTNQYFTYHALDYDRYKKLSYPNMITWSLEKVNGEDVDTWCSLPLTSTLDLDGEKGEVTLLQLFNNEIFCFQPQGVSQILFNSRVQIPTSDGQPIEITNGYKVQGKRYLTTNIGVTNKWSVQSTNNGLYFIDDERNSLYRLNGQGLEDLSTKLGFRTWLTENNSYGVWDPVSYTNLRTFYDKVNMDLYFTTKSEALVFSEQLNNFVSFMDYGGVETMFNLNDKFYAFTQGEEVQSPLPHRDSVIWEMFGGDYNSFFGEFKPYWLSFIANADPVADKIFNTLEWRTLDYNTQGVLEPLSTFDNVRVWNDHQDTGLVPLENIPGKPSVLKKKFNVFRSWVPRDMKGGWGTPIGRDRIRNPWTYVELSRRTKNYDMLIFTDLTVGYFL